MKKKKENHVIKKVVVYNSYLIVYYPGRFPLIRLNVCINWASQGKNLPSGKELACQSRRHKRCGFDPCVGKIPWRRAWQLTPVFLPGKSPRTEEPGGLWSTESDMTEVT